MLEIEAEYPDLSYPQQFSGLAIVALLQFLELRTKTVIFLNDESSAVHLYYGKLNGLGN